MKGSMTSGNPLKLILSFSIPLLLGNLFQQTYNMVDAAIVGQTLGSEALAAVGSSSSVQFFVLGFCMGTCIGFSIPVAQKFGAQDYDDMKEYVYGGAIWSVIVAIIMTVITCLLCSKILDALQVSSEIFDMAYQYLIVIFIGIPFTILYNFLSGLLRAIGDSKTPFLFLALSAVLNIFLDFFCILVLHWGTAGAAIATIFSQAVSGILCLFVIMKKVEILHINKENRVMNKEISKNLIMMGVPMGLQYSITAIGSMVMQSANNSLGTLYTSGFTAGMKIKQFIMCPFDAFATAVSTFASQNYGAKKMDRVRAGIKQGTIVSVIYGIVAGIIMNLFGRQMSLLFLSADNVEVLNASYLYVSRIGMFYWVLGFLIVDRMSLQGLGYANRAVLCGVVEMVGRCFVSIVLVPKFGYDAITFADQVAWIGGTIYVVYQLMKTLKYLDEKLKQEQSLENLNA